MNETMDELIVRGCRVPPSKRELARLMRPTADRTTGCVVCGKRHRRTVGWPSHVVIPVALKLRCRVCRRCADGLSRAGVWDEFVQDVAGKLGIVRESSVRQEDDDPYWF